MNQIDLTRIPDSFWVSVAVEALGALLGTVGAFVVAWLIFRRTTKDERERFEQSLKHERDIFREQIAHDLAMRRHEDVNRQRERDEAEKRLRLRSLQSLAAEIDLNLESLLMQRLNRPGGVFLRSNALDQAFPYFATLPTSVAKRIQYASVMLDRYNHFKDEGYSNEIKHADEMNRAQDAFLEVKQSLSDYLKEEET
jgi:hypothetical protein